VHVSFCVSGLVGKTAVGGFAAGMVNWRHSEVWFSGNQRGEVWRTVEPGRKECHHGREGDGTAEEEGGVGAGAGGCGCGVGASGGEAARGAALFEDRGGGPCPGAGGELPGAGAADGGGGGAAGAAGAMSGVWEVGGGDGGGAGGEVRGWASQAGGVEGLLPVASTGFFLCVTDWGRIGVGVHPVMTCSEPWIYKKLASFAVFIIVAKSASRFPGGLNAIVISTN
jgi:hypothetical protein